MAAELAGLADLYVDDAFGAAHRAHASTEGVAHLLPSAAGLLLAAELDAFQRLLDAPAHPFVVVIGGVKVADKIGVIDRFTHLADTILIGGAMAFTFLAAEGIDVGASRHEDEDGQDTARAGDGGRRRARLRAAACRPTWWWPTASPRTPPRRWSTPMRSPTAGWGSTSGRETVDALQRCAWPPPRTIFWNGPMGVFEMAPFAAGTLAVAHAVAAPAATSVVGGGDSVAAVNAAGVADRDHPRLDRRRRRPGAGRGQGAAGRRGAGVGSAGMSRRPFVAGNWKMHKTASQAGPFVRELAGRVPEARGRSRLRPVHRSGRRGRRRPPEARCRCSPRTCTSSSRARSPARCRPPCCSTSAWTGC